MLACKKAITCRLIGKPLKIIFLQKSSSHALLEEACFQELSQFPATPSVNKPVSAYHASRAK